MSNPDPWADPATPTRPGAPYAGPPPTGPHPSGYGPGYASATYGHPAQYGYPPQYGPPPPYGYPAPWGPPPARGPQRPGQVITTAVLAFVQAALVLIASLYVWFFASVVDALARESPGMSPADAGALATEGTVLAIVQLLSAVLLVVAGIRALVARTRTAWLLILAAHALQVVLAVYWAVRLSMLMDAAPGPDPDGVFVAVTVFFGAAPLVGLGLVLFGAGRRWFDGPQLP